MAKKKKLLNWYKIYFSIFFSPSWQNYLAFVLRAINKYAYFFFLSNLPKKKKKSRKMKKKNSSIPTLQAEFQLKMYFYSCYELLELVILGNHLLLTWASFRGELLPKFTLYDYFEWIGCPENSPSATSGLEFTFKILVKEILLTQSRTGDICSVSSLVLW